MSIGERLTVWNRRYDNAPEGWRFYLVVGLLVALGAINMVLTVAFGFPFALLVVLGIIVLIAIRVPYSRGWVRHAGGAEADLRFKIRGARWVIAVNRRYEALPEAFRMWIFPAVLVIGGVVNMLLTIYFGFPFGLLLLLTLLGLVLIRAPYTAGWLTEGESPVVVEHHAVPPVVRADETVSGAGEHVIPPVAASVVAVDGSAVSGQMASPEQSFPAGLPPADSAH